MFRERQEEEPKDPRKSSVSWTGVIHNVRAELERSIILFQNNEMPLWKISIERCQRN